MLAFLQLDSPSVPLLEQMLERGDLPVLAGLRARGRSFELDAETGLFETALFPSLYSGVEVGEHGLYATYSWSPAEQRARFMHDLPQPAAAWERLARAGRRSLVVDPYQAWPPAQMSGVFLSGWQATNRMVMPRCSVPGDTLGLLARRFGAPPPGELVFGRPNVAYLLRQRAALLDAPRRLADAVTDLVRRQAFDLVWVGFSCIHLAGHGLWDLSQVAGDTIDPAARRALESALADVYVATDTALGRIVETLSPGGDLIVFSPDGMGPDTSCSDMLPDMLGAILSAAPPGARPGHGGPGSVLWRLRAVVPAWCRAGIARVLGDTRARDVAARLHFSDVEWTRTRAFAAPGDFHGFVRLNLRGRERDGIVEPGAEAEALLDEIAAGLATFCDPDGSPSVTAVERVPGSIRRGTHGDRLPDLVVRWSDRPRAGVRELHSPRFGRVARRGAGTALAGNHADGAWALVLPASSRARVPSRPPRIVDLAATACALLGADMTGLAGEPLLERP